MLSSSLAQIAIVNPEKENTYQEELPVAILTQKFKNKKQTSKTNKQKTNKEECLAAIAELKPLT